MKVLVTGGAGFIGSHLVRRLVDDGNEVVVIDNLSRGNKLDKDVLKHISLVLGDVRNEDLILSKSEGCDIVYHFAAVLGVDIVADNPLETMETETLSMQHLGKAAAIHKISKIIYASTSGVYGKAAIEKAVSEDLNVSPSSSYSIAKRYNEIYLKALYQEKNISSIALRFFNVYGPRQDQRMVIPRFIDQAQSHQPLTVYGSGNQTRDFTYIDDCIEACIRVAELGPGMQVLNVSNNREYSIFELAQLVVKLTNSNSQISLISPPQDRYDFEVERRFGSSQKLLTLTNFCPDTDLEDGLLRILSHVNS
ncbi:MAG: dTDP-glucose 4,6-dehydratase [Ignavibacteriaceae bacterium]|nr:dTDP-glucose 4,6-dehydratase [Ignavibacteriaceae bacterium]